MKKIIITILFLSVSSVFSQSWHKIGNEIVAAGFYYVASSIVYNSNLIIGGLDTNIENGFIKMWNGTNWVQIGTTQSNNQNNYGTVRSLGIYNGNLIAGGYFTSVNGIVCNGVAGWNGTNWFAFDSGVGGTTPHVEAIITYPSFNSSGKLYIGGTFSEMHGNPVAGIARWNPASSKWEAVGTIPPVIQRQKIGIYSFAEYLGKLYCGGTYVLKVENELSKDSAIIGKFDGTNSWLPVGGGIPIGDSACTVKTMTVFGGYLIAAGHFQKAGSLNVKNIVQWNNTSWSQFPFQIDSSGMIYAMCTQGSNLYLSGIFSTPSLNLAKYPNPNPFLNDSCNDGIITLTNYPAGTVNLVVGGWFNHIDGMSVNHVARWGDSLVGVLPHSQVITDFSLSQNYPNPFNPNTKFNFQVAKLSNVKVVIYDIVGREVTTLFNMQLMPGTYEALFDGTNYTSGIYFYKMIAGDFTEVKKMVLIK